MSEISAEYEGELNTEELPHGVGVQRVSVDGMLAQVYRGHFFQGTRQGKGRLECYDEEGDVVEVYAGMFEDDELQDTSAEEYSGEDVLLYKGGMSGSDRHGRGTIYLADGGEIYAIFDGGDVVPGSAATYVYPQQHKHGRVVDTLVGILNEEGDFENASFVEQLYERIEENEKKGGKEKEEKEKGCISFDEATDSRISSNPLLPDMYEQKRVYVAPSTIPGAGFGLFAKRPLEANEIASFYNGVRLTHQEVDERDWSLNGNTITLNNEIVIDVPAHLAQTSAYNASLGHFANHCTRRQNAAYDLCFHPRFGDIKCMFSPFLFCLSGYLPRHSNHTRCRQRRRASCRLWIHARYVA
ncbi:MAG: hypothetical protein MHM6MM_001692 [Cercozoa sp. M6MM]